MARLCGNRQGARGDPSRDAAQPGANAAEKAADAGIGFVPALLARLQANGLDEGLRAEMAQLSAVLSRVGEVREQNAERNRCIAGELLVIRAGLFGDLSRFSQIAAITVPRPHAAPLKLQNLLPLWRRSSPGVRDVPSEALPPRG